MILQGSNDPKDHNNPVLTQIKKKDMPNQGNELNRINLLYTVALFIYNESRLLVRGGFGQDIHGNDLGDTPIINDIGMDTPEYLFVDRTIRFVRYVAQIFALALTEYQEIENDTQAGNLMREPLHDIDPNNEI